MLSLTPKLKCYQKNFGLSFLLVSGRSVTGFSQIRIERQCCRQAFIWDNVNLDFETLVGTNIYFFIPIFSPMRKETRPLWLCYSWMFTWLYIIFRVPLTFDAVGPFQTSRLGLHSYQQTGRQVKPWEMPVVWALCLWRPWEPTGHSNVLSAHFRGAATRACRFLDTNQSLDKTLKEAFPVLSSCLCWYWNSMAFCFSSAESQ